MHTKPGNAAVEARPKAARWTWPRPPKVLRWAVRLLVSGFTGALVAWAVGWVWTDRWIWTQLLWWTGVVWLIVAVGTLGGAWVLAGVGRFSRGHRPWWTTAWLALLAACGLEGWHQFNGRAWLAKDTPPPANTLLIAQWNISAGELSPGLVTLMRDRLGSTGRVDVALITVANYPDQWSSIRQAMGEGPDRTIEMASAGMSRVFSAYPIRRSRAFSVPTRRESLLRLPRVMDRMFMRGLTELGVMPRDPDRLAPVTLHVVTLDTTGVFGRDTTIYFIDYPSSPLISRAELASGVRRQIDLMMNPLAPKHPGDAPADPVPAPDVIMGDFNTPRSSHSIVTLLDDYRPATDYAGIGKLGTFPRRWPLYHIDNTLLSPSWAAGEYGVINGGSSEHWAQRVRIWPVAP
jgi:hypothetical protein